MYPRHSLIRLTQDHISPQYDAVRGYHKPPPNVWAQAQQLLAILNETRMRNWKTNHLFTSKGIDEGICLTRLVSYFLIEALLGR